MNCHRRWAIGAAVNIAAQAGARVIATTRNASRAAMLEALGAGDVLLEAPDLASKLRERMPQRCRDKIVVTI
jgi:NADPH:quinone reductase-like Zn-dependent oxidoreductase